MLFIFLLRQIDEFINKKFQLITETQTQQSHQATQNRIKYGNQPEQTPYMSYYSAINQFDSVSKKQSSSPTSQLLSLYSKRGSSINMKQGGKTIKLLTQQNEGFQAKKNNNKSVIKLKPINKQDDMNDPKLGKDVKQKIIIETTGITDSKTDSAASSRTSLHPAVNQIQALISDETRNLVLPVKAYNQALLGQVSSIWWCVVDSLFLSLQKVLKVKQTQPSPEKQGRNSEKSKGEQAQKSRKQSPNKGQKQKQSTDKGGKKINGVIESNTKASIELSRVYSYLEEENKKNEQTVLKYYEDPNHVALILQAYFYEKAVIYLLGTIRKWNHHEQHLYIHSLAIDLIPCIIQCRKLIIDILMEAVQNEQQDNKIRKPKYIARQKKLIQISKFTTLMKSQYEKYSNSLGSPHRYKVFYLAEALREHSLLVSLQQKWRNVVFEIPIPPFISEKPNKKQFLLVIQPLNLLYKYNKKEESLQIDSYTELFLKNLSYLFDIVFFTHADKESSLLNFLGVLDQAEIMGVLDKHYLTHLTAKLTKDISKIGGGYPQNKILVLDDKNNSKYYLGCKHSLLLLQGNHAEAKIARVNGKLVKMDEHDENYLRNLCAKITNCAEKGGHWQQIIHEKGQRKK